MAPVEVSLFPSAGFRFALRALEIAFRIFLEEG